MELIKLFPTPVLVDTISVSEYSSILNEVLPHKEKIYENLEDYVWKDNVESSISKIDNIIAEFNWPILKEIIDLRVKEFLSCHKFYKNKNYELNASWINITQHNGYQGLHVHGGDFSTISGVIYLDVPPGDLGNIFFMLGPREDTFYGSSEIKPENGKIIIFPGFFPHGVLPNKTNTKRVSLSFNYEKIK